MIKTRGKEHTTLTETAAEIVTILKRIPGTTMIAPGIIKTNRRSSSQRYVTAVFTTAGMELIITGQSVQKVAIHCNQELSVHIFETLKQQKKLAHIKFKARERKPGIR